MTAPTDPAVTVPAPMAAEAESKDLHTLGVEEEYLLADPVGPDGVDAVENVFGELPDDLADSVQREFQQSQIEVASPPQLHLGELHDAMRRLRTGVAAAAERAGVRLVAIGAAPGTGPNTGITDKPRYHRMRERYGDLSYHQGLNGMHVHVSIPDPESGVQVLNHLRPWLPVLQAVTANSPLSGGVDTGYASWRSMLWERWPTVGPTPYLASHEQYETLVSDLEATGAMLDEGMLYWYGRLAVRYPTVEIRMGDVCPSLDDTVLLAALTRALVATIMHTVRDGVPAPDVPQPLLVAAHWRAARDGLEGLNIDMATRQSRPTWKLLRQLVDHVGPELERHGDREMVGVLLGRLRSHGTGAARQRAIVAHRGSVADVVDWLAAATKA